MKIGTVPLSAEVELLPRELQGKVVSFALEEICRVCKNEVYFTRVIFDKENSRIDVFRIDVKGGVNG